MNEKKSQKERHADEMSAHGYGMECVYAYAFHFHEMRIRREKSCARVNRFTLIDIEKPSIKDAHI